MSTVSWITARGLFGPGPRGPKSWDYRFFKGLTAAELEAKERQQREQNRST